MKDIEELAKVAGNCKVKRSGCQAKCMSAPNVTVTLNGKQDVYRRVRANGLAQIVQKASDNATALRKSGLYKPGYQERLAKAFMEFRQKHGWTLSKTLKAPNTTSGDSSMFFDEKHISWRIDKVDVVSRWSAIYRCTSLAPTENVLIPGRQIWHVSLFAKGLSEEFVGREYTPISTITDWEQGKCDLLVKIYPDGKMTSRLHATTAGDEILLSSPKATLQIPSLTVGASSATFSSVLLVVGGTGITAALQVLEQFRYFDMQDIPVTLIYSCREDDVLMAPELDFWALDQGTTQKGPSKAILALTEPVETASPPFPGAVAPLKSQLDKACSGLRIVDGRVSEVLLFGELDGLPKPIRTVVCGPEAMNVAIEKMLVQSPCAASLQITVLEG